MYRTITWNFIPITLEKYMIEILSVNGIFPVFTTDSTGHVRYTLSANKVVRPDARSIVIHEPGSGAKIACADLD